MSTSKFKEESNGVSLKEMVDRYSLIVQPLMTNGKTHSKSTSKFKVRPLKCSNFIKTC